MNKSGGEHRRPSFRNLLRVGAVLAPLSLLLSVGSVASAEVPPQGSAEIIFGDGPSGKELSKAGVQVGAGGAASATRLVGGKVRITTPVRTVSVAERSTVGLDGNITFSRKGRKVLFSALSLTSTEATNQTSISATVGGSTFPAFQLGAAATVDERVGTVSFSGRPASMTKRAAKLLSDRLGLGKLRAAKAGTAVLSSQAAFEDPYAETCQLPATSKVAGDLPVAPLPEPVAGGTTAIGNGITWGIRSGLRNYLFFLPDGQGVMQGIDGGQLVPNPAPPPAPPVPTGFSFPFSSGSWDLGEEAAGDEKVLLEGSGSILLCHKTQFRILLSNPKIVVDGFDARLVVDVDTNVLGEWIPQTRVRLANLVTSTATFQQVDGTATWSSVPVVLTEAGSKALRLAPFSPTFRYQAGQSLESISFTLASTPVG